MEAHSQSIKLKMHEYIYVHSYVAAPSSFVLPPDCPADQKLSASAAFSGRNSHLVLQLSPEIAINIHI